MKVIKKLSEMIEDEIGDVKKYSKYALKYRDEYPQLASDLHTLSLEEAKHLKLLHSDVEKLIKDYREKKGEPPAAMLAVYEYLHDRHIDEYNEAKRYQDEYK